MTIENVLKQHVTSQCESKRWAFELLERVRKVKQARGANKVSEINSLELELMGKLYQSEHDPTIRELLFAFYHESLQELEALNEKDKELWCLLKLNTSKSNLSSYYNVSPTSIQNMKQNLLKQLNQTNNQHHIIPNI